jgi:hypothetical protein
MASGNLDRVGLALIDAEDAALRLLNSVRQARDLLKADRRSEALASPPRQVFSQQHASPLPMKVQSPVKRPEFAATLAGQEPPIAFASPPRQVFSHQHASPLPMTVQSPIKRPEFAATLAGQAPPIAVLPRSRQIPRQLQPSTMTTSAPTTALSLPPPLSPQSAASLPRNLNHIPVYPIDPGYVTHRKLSVAQLAASVNPAVLSERDAAVSPHGPPVDGLRRVSLSSTTSSAETRHSQRGGSIQGGVAPSIADTSVEQSNLRAEQAISSALNVASSSRAAVANSTRVMEAAPPTHQIAKSTPLAGPLPTSSSLPTTTTQLLPPLPPPASRWLPDSSFAPSVNTTTLSANTSGTADSLFLPKPPALLHRTGAGVLRASQPMFAPAADASIRRQSVATTTSSGRHHEDYDIMPRNVSSSGIASEPQSPFRRHDERYVQLSRTMEPGGTLPTRVGHESLQEAGDLQTSSLLSLDETSRFIRAMAVSVSEASLENGNEYYGTSAAQDQDQAILRLLGALQHL